MTTLGTFTIAADPADCAAAFMLDHAAAFWAGAPLEGGRLDSHVNADGLHVGLDRFGDRIGAGEHLVVAEACGAVAGDAEELLDYLASAFVENGWHINSNKPLDEFLKRDDIDEDDDEI